MGAISFTITENSFMCQKGKIEAISYVRLSAIFYFSYYMSKYVCNLAMCWKRKLNYNSNSY